MGEEIGVTENCHWILRGERARKEERFLVFNGKLMSRFASWVGKTNRECGFGMLSRKFNIKVRNSIVL